MGGLGEHDPVRRRHLLEAGGDIGGIANGRVVHTQVVANGPDNHQPGVQPQAYRHLHAVLLPQRGGPCVQALPQANGGQHRSPGMVFMGNGGAKQGHKAITQELVDGALVAVHLAQGQLEELVEQRVHSFWPQAFGQGCVVGQVAEEHRDLLTLACERGAGSKNFFGQVSGGVGERYAFLGLC